MSKTSEEFKALSISEFTKDSKRYDTDQPGMYETCKRNYPELFALISKHKFTNLLDVGCGTGLLIQMLSEEFPNRKFTGIDITPAMIDKAKQKHLPNADFIIGDSENLPFDDESFDIIISCESFHHYPNPEAFLSEARRCLTPGGILFIRDYMAGRALVFIYNHIFLRLVNVFGHGDVAVYTKTTLQNMCKATKLHLISLEQLPGLWHKMNLIAKKI